MEEPGVGDSNQFLTVWVKTMKKMILASALSMGIAVASATVSAAVSGDLNQDGIVSFSDLNVMQAEYGKRGASVADLDGNRRVDRYDVRVFHYLLGHNGGDFTADTALTDADIDVFRAAWGQVLYCSMASGVY